MFGDTQAEAARPISVSVRTSNLIHATWLAGALLGAPALCLAQDAPLRVVSSDAPQRVVSMNLCTDQLAMLIAGDGQLLSVSQLASDPRSSSMVKQAGDYITNQGRAEEIYLMQPDLVLTSPYSARATVRMLERLGIKVVAFDITNSLAEIPEQMMQMGEVLGQQERAAKLVEEFQAGLDAFQTDLATRPKAALYQANGYTSGDRSLAGEIVTLAGFENAAVAAGYAGGGIMPLEVLAMAQPDAVIQSLPYDGGSRAEEIMNHPAVAAFRDDGQAAGLTNHDWVCGTPFVLQAIAEMAALRERVQQQGASE